jgi:hypothetical protein
VKFATIATSDALACTVTVVVLDEAEPKTTLPEPVAVHPVKA